MVSAFALRPLRFGKLHALHSRSNGSRTARVATNFITSSILSLTSRKSFAESTSKR